MNRYLYPYVTGADHRRYKCQLRQKHTDESDNTIYTFINESTGDCYQISKLDNKWIFVDGNTHLNHWIEELGNYIDENGA